MSITYQSFAATLAGLTVTGITTSLTEPPAIDTSGNYPMMFPRVPSVERGAITLASSAGLKTVTCELVIVVERDSLSTPYTKFSTTMAILDALDTALVTEMVANNVIDSWTIDPEINEYGWTLVATVEGSG
jgi:hypothetical protein